MSHEFHTGHPIPELLDLPMSDAAWVAAVDAESEPHRELEKALAVLADRWREPRGYQRARFFYDVLRTLSKRSFLAFHSLRAALWALEKRVLEARWDDRFCAGIIELAPYELEATLARVRAISRAERAGPVIRRATLRVSLPSSFQPGHVHAAGTNVRLVQRVRPDDDSRWWVEIRVPEGELEGGAWYETLEVVGDDIEW